MASLISKETLETEFDTHFQDTHDNWKALCPFHSEKTPSFYIHKTDLVGHCFGCGVAGRVDVLLARLKHISAAQARNELGLTSLPWLDKVETPQPEPIYPQSWIHAWKRISMHPYLEQRGFTHTTVEAFELRWDPQTRRVVFPLISSESRVVGAVGRATTGLQPKYYFYWNCDKGQSVWTARDFWMAPQDSVIVVEGMMDCMWLWQNGFKSVALIGASATKEQTAQLKEFHSVTIALDNDDAGKIGAENLHRALKNSCRIQYASYPSYAKDANDLTQDELQEIFANPITPVEMKLYD